MVKWDEVAKGLHFKNPEELLSFYYKSCDNDVKKMAAQLGISYPTLMKKMDELGIVKKRMKQGQHPGMYICRYCGETNHGDKRNICCNRPECQEKDRIFKVSQISNLMKKKKVDKKKRPCRICGKDRGKNRFFCNHCLTFVNVGTMDEGLLIL